MENRHRQLSFLLILGIFLSLTNLPYLFASAASDSTYVFGGILINPLDGNSYFAKMYEGWRGDWRFTLPYTADPGEGAYIFLFYIALGHIARLASLSLPLVFHLARLLCSTALLLALYRFFKWLMPELAQHNLALVLAALGSGMGWLALAFGAFTSDLWVAEAYPFLCAYATPHFSLGLALLVGLLTGIPKEGANTHLPEAIASFLAATALAVVSPFGVVIALVVLGWLALPEWRSLRKPWSSPLNWRLLWVLAGGGPILVYEFLATRFDPVLSGWDAQNLTASPPVWDLLVSLLPVFAVAMAGLWVAGKRNHLEYRLLAAWACLGLALVYFPWDLQRRFMMGLFVPLAGLAVLGLEKLKQSYGPRTRFLPAAILLLALPSNLVILLAGLHGITTHDSLLYLTTGEVQALEWVEANTQPQALILAAPETGLFIPAHTGRRVVYGHPFETVNAAVMKAWVAGAFTQNAFAGPETAGLGRYDFVFYGPREQKLGGPLPASGLRPVYSAQGITIYAVEAKGSN